MVAYLKASLRIKVTESVVESSEFLPGGQLVGLVESSVGECAQLSVFVGLTSE